MHKLKDFIKTSLLGGIVVILPSAVLVLIARWIFDVFTGLVGPLIAYIIAYSRVYEFLANLIVIAIILLTCFMLGVMVRTRLGNWLFIALETRILRRVPGYSLIKETVIQFFGSGKSPFSAVALVQLFENGTLTTAFVTDIHDNGCYTVFVPTGPMPTAGNIYHVDARYVHLVEVSVEEAMRSIFGFGAGSQKLIAALGNRVRQ